MPVTTPLVTDSMLDEPVSVHLTIDALPRLALVHLAVRDHGAMVLTPEQAHAIASDLRRAADRAGRRGPAGAGAARRGPRGRR